MSRGLRTLASLVVFATLIVPKAATPPRARADQNSFSSSGPIAIPDGTQGQAAPFPSDLVVTSIPNSIQKVTVTLTNLTHSRPDDLDIVLIFNGVAVMLMSDVGGTTPATGVTLVFDDSAAASVPDNGPLVAGTYRPTNVGSDDPFLTPPTDATLSAFNGMDPNGTWELQVVDDEGLGGTGSIGSWSLTFTVGTTAGFAETRGVPARIPGGSATSGPAAVYPWTQGGLDTTPYTISHMEVKLLGLSHERPNDIDMLLVGPQGQSVILMSDTGGSVGTSNVDVTLDDAAASIIPASQFVPFSGGTYKPTNRDSGDSDAFLLPAPQGAHGATLSVFNGSATAGDWELYIMDDSDVATGSLAGWGIDFTLSYTPTVTKSSPIQIPAPDTGVGPAQPYPSNITVSGLAGTISKVVVTLTNLSHTFPDDLDMLLVGPTGANAIILSDVGGDQAASNVTIVLDDAAASSLPDGAPLVSGTFKPRDIGDLSPDSFPPPAPAPAGGSALSAFNGTNPNGTWSLFIVDDSVGDRGTLAGWSLTITTGAGPIATPTRTPTRTPTPGPGTPSVTPAGSTATPPSGPSSTPTRTPTAPPGSLSGHGFSLEVSPGEAIHAHWSDGLLETGYLVLRIDLSGGMGISPLGQLGANATSIDDPSPTGIDCYVVLVQGGNPVGSISYGQSDGLCVFLGVAAGHIPPHFKLELDESPISTLTWQTPPGGAPLGYTLVVIPVDGSSLELQALPPGTTSKTHDTRGHITCYQLLVNGGGDNKTNALCAFPNASTLVAGGATSAALGRLREGLHLPSAPSLRSAVSSGSR